jgi:UDP-N-acetylglucosamine acyltransferase
LIHPTALVHPNADLGKNVSVGPYSVIEDGVSIGEGTSVGNYTTVKSGTTIGKGCHIFHNCSIGEIPQDLKFKGEETQVEIGDNVTIRESVTINRGTADKGKTVIGSNVLLMATVHVAHDCFLGDHVIMSNLTTLGGHVTVEDYAILGGCVLVHQFTNIGAHVFIGGGFRAVQDVPPYILAAGEPLAFKGLNKIGLDRRGFSNETIAAIKKAYRLIYIKKAPKKEVIEKIQNELNDVPEAMHIAEFLSSSERGII